MLVVTSGWDTNISETSERDDFGPFAGVDEHINGSVGLPLAGNFAQTMWKQSKDNKLQRLSNDECFGRYSSQLQSSASNVVVVTNQTTGKYRTTPEIVGVISEVDHDSRLDPFRTFEMPGGVGASINPFSGNAALLLGAEMAGYATPMTY